MIQFDNVTKRYPGGIDALKNLSFKVEKGEMVFLAGHSGAGKSTLLRLVAGIDRATSGTVLVNNQNLGKLGGTQLSFMRQHIGLVFQDHKILFDRSVFDNVMLPLDIIGFEPREAAKRVRAALDKVGLLDREKSNPIRLSGGEQQRLCIARAVVHRPSILLADEPTGNLDAATGQQIINMMFELNAKQGTTLILVTHDEAIAARCGRILRIQSGRLG